jgi:hypothetical protein
VRQIPCRAVVSVRSHVICRPVLLVVIPFIVVATYGLLPFAAQHFSHVPLWQQYGVRANAFLQSHQARAPMVVRLRTPSHEVEKLRTSAGSAIELLGHLKLSEECFVVWAMLLLVYSSRSSMRSLVFRV